MSIGYINVHGLKNKLKFCEFYDFVNRFDIECFDETFITSEEIEEPTNDTTTIKGYKTIHKIRYGNPKKPSGGIAISIRANIASLVEHIKNDCINSIWCKIRNNIAFQDNPLFIPCIYVPPVNSLYIEK